MSRSTIERSPETVAPTGGDPITPVGRTVVVGVVLLVVLFLPFLGLFLSSNPS